MLQLIAALWLLSTVDARLISSLESESEDDLLLVPQRDLQLEILDQFQYNFGGITVNQTVAEEACPDEWGATLICGPGACGANIDDIEEICPGLANPTEPDAFLAERVPDCDELEELFCEVFGGSDLQECCLMGCDVQIKNLNDCLILDKTGEDRSECPVPVCRVTNAPTEIPTMPPTSPPTFPPTTGEGTMEVASTAPIPSTPATPPTFPPTTVEGTVEVASTAPIIILSEPPAGTTQNNNQSSSSSGVGASLGASIGSVVAGIAIITFGAVVIVY